MHNLHPPPRRRPAAVKNRIASIALHVPRYQIKTVSRLAKDAKVAKSAVSRLMRGEGEPSYMLVSRIADAISKEIGMPLDHREIAVPADAEYPTTCPCRLFGCTCLPDWAYDRDGNLRWQFWDVRPGEWTLDRSELNS